MSKHVDESNENGQVGAAKPCKIVEIEKNLIPKFDVSDFETNEIKLRTPKLVEVDKGAKWKFRDITNPAEMCNLVSAMSEKKKYKRINPFTTEPQAIFLLLENENFGLIN